MERLTLIRGDIEERQVLVRIVANSILDGQMQSPQERVVNIVPDPESGQLQATYNLPVQNHGYENAFS